MSKDRIFSRIHSGATSGDPGEKTNGGDEKISAALLRAAFSDCADFILRPVWPGGTPREGVSVCWLDGLVSGEELSRDVLCPLTDSGRLAPEDGPEIWCDRLLHGAVWSCQAQRCDSAVEVISAVTAGCCAVLFDGPGCAVTFEVKSTAGRSVGMPSVEKTVKGGKDAFVETLRVNTMLVRRRLRSPDLKLVQTTVGRRSATKVAILYLEGVTDPRTVAELRQRLDGLDVDGLTASGNLEQYLTDRPGSPFPQLLHTERPERFAAELLAGRVGLLADGLPVGFLLPATLACFFRVAEDRAQHFLIASLLTLLRWGSALLSLLFPALFVAISMYHQEMIPTRLLLSMIAAEQQVPFSVALEVLGMLAAFELLMEAGVRLPDPVGDTVSIIGALIVGQSAVEARVVSPIAVIVVATTAICGFTLPSRDLGSALRLGRFLMVLLAIGLGLFGIAAGIALLVWYLSTLESFGTAYLAPLCDGGWREKLRVLLQPPLPRVKSRAYWLHPTDRRNQK